MPGMVLGHSHDLPGKLAMASAQTQTMFALGQVDVRNSVFESNKGRSINFLDPGNGSFPLPRGSRARHLAQKA